MNQKVAGEIYCANPESNNEREVNTLKNSTILLNQVIFLFRLIGDKGAAVLYIGI